MKRISFVIALLLGLTVTHSKVTQPCRRKPAEPITPVTKTLLQSVEAPEQWIWNNIEGSNYLTNMRN
jgi:hypothetical protein